MTRFIALGGFLGAGKTTMMLRAAQELQARGEVVAVITNDQGEDLVDSAAARDAGIAGSGEVTGGCFCCRFDELADVVDGLLDTHRPTVVLAEAVGSCTDLQSTVVRPLRALHGDALEVAPLAVLVDPDRYRHLRSSFGTDGDDASDLTHLYHHQLAEADAIVVNKVDTLGAAERGTVVADLERRFPRTTVLTCSAARGDGVDTLIELWSGGTRSGRVPFAVDYDRYGAAEAELAWTNQVYDVTGAFTADGWLDAFFADLGPGVRDVTVGHVKVRVATARGCAKASLVSSDVAVRRDGSEPSPTDRATALVNARVAVAPPRLDELVAHAVGAADRACASTSSRVRGEVFRPGYPVPRHRM